MLNDEVFHINCFPVINLCNVSSKPLYMNEMGCSYPLLVDDHGADKLYDVYSVLDLKIWNSGGVEQKVKPLFAHDDYFIGNDVIVWDINRVQSVDTSPDFVFS